MANQSLKTTSQSGGDSRNGFVYVARTSRAARRRTHEAIFGVWVFVCMKCSLGKRLLRAKIWSKRFAAILYFEPELKPKFPPNLQTLLDKSLQKDAENRYQTAEDMIADLKHLRQEIEFAEQLQIHASSGTTDTEIHETLSQFLSEHPTIAIQTPTQTRKSSENRMEIACFYSFDFFNFGGWRLVSVAKLSHLNCGAWKFSKRRKN